MAEIEQIFPCVICGRAWSNKQSLRAHMKVHKGEYLRTSIHVRKDLWESFSEVCKKHKTTTCALLDVLMKATLAGEESGSIDLTKIGTPNPVVISVQEVFMGRPRGRNRLEISRMIPEGPGCPTCGSREVRTISPEGVEYSEGSCLRCRARWLVTR